MTNEVRADVIAEVVARAALVLLEAVSQEAQGATFESLRLSMERGTQRVDEVVREIRTSEKPPETIEARADVLERYASGNVQVAAAAVAALFHSPLPTEYFQASRFTPHTAEAPQEDRGDG